MDSLRSHKLSVCKEDLDSSLGLYLMFAKEARTHTHTHTYTHTHAYTQFLYEHLEEPVAVSVQLSYLLFEK